MLVGDAWQGQGTRKPAHRLLLDRNVDRGRVREIYGVTGRTNTRMIRVFKRFGFDIGPASDPTLLLAVRKIS